MFHRRWHQKYSACARLLTRTQTEVHAWTDKEEEEMKMWGLRLGPLNRWCPDWDRRALKPTTIGVEEGEERTRERWGGVQQRSQMMKVFLRYGHKSFNLNQMNDMQLFNTSWLMNVNNMNLSRIIYLMFESSCHWFIVWPGVWCRRP